jgi:hypothetical protein
MLDCQPIQSTMPTKKRFADQKDQIIQAVLGGHYTFASMEQAQLQLDIIKSNYFISKVSVV